ncbi:MAG TPA: 5-formyltetrahydrofolate cyclo-ligase [Anaerohalosphaeraceae bacterium]|nr:5-formyltetrahydrofolate cyclo-ligase [Anaerohalosphaeraceae bacterium]
MNKTELRALIRSRLAALPAEERLEKSRQICRWVMESDVFRQATVVMAFLSMPYEVDTTPLILQSWRQGKTIAVPKISWEQRHMIPVEIQSLESGLETGKKGLRNPTGGVPVPLEEIDLVLTPGLAFDVQGNRLGRGGAYYDRFFKNPGLSAARWALAFSFQVVEEVPVGPEDEPVDAVVTETGILLCRKRTQSGGQ